MEKMLRNRIKEIEREKELMENEHENKIEELKKLH